MLQILLGFYEQGKNIWLSGSSGSEVTNYFQLPGNKDYFCHEGTFVGGGEKKREKEKKEEQDPYKAEEGVIFDATLQFSGFQGFLVMRRFNRCLSSWEDHLNFYTVRGKVTQTSVLLPIFIPCRGLLSCVFASE